MSTKHVSGHWGPMISLNIGDSWSHGNRWVWSREITYNEKRIKRQSFGECLTATGQTQWRASKGNWEGNCQKGRRRTRRERPRDKWLSRRTEWLTVEMNSGVINKVRTERDTAHVVVYEFVREVLVYYSGVRSQDAWIDEDSDFVQEAWLWKKGERLEEHPGSRVLYLLFV